MRAELGARCSGFVAGGLASVQRLSGSVCAVHAGHTRTSRPPECCPLPVGVGPPGLLRAVVKLRSDPAAGCTGTRSEARPRGRRPIP